MLHIELRRWSDALVIAPLSANSLAKLAGGMCDNLLTCIVRAWDFNRPLLVCQVAALLGIAIYRIDDWSNEASVDCKQALQQKLSLC